MDNVLSKIKTETEKVDSLLTNRDKSYLFVYYHIIIVIISDYYYLKYY